MARNEWIFAVCGALSLPALAGCASNSSNGEGSPGIGGTSNSGGNFSTGGKGGAASGGSAGVGGKSTGGSSSGGSGGQATGGSGGTSSGGGAGAPATGGSAGASGGSGGSTTQPAGSLDTTYGNAGVVTGASVTAFADAADVSAIAFQSDGKALMVGTKVVGQYIDFYTVRYSEDGTLDGSFGDFGARTDDVGNYADTARAVSIDDNGKIWVAGTKNAFGLVRYSTAGKLDSSFDSDGKVLTQIGWGAEANAIATSPGGAFVAGSAEIYLGAWDFCAVLYAYDGTPSPYFDQDGIAIYDLGEKDVARAIAIQSDGRILLAGDVIAPNGTSDIGVIRIYPSGALDTSFGDGGKTLIQIGAIDTLAPTGVAIAPDGKIVLAGETASGQNRDFFAARLTPSGKLDTSFSNDGVQTYDGAPLDYARGLVLDSHGILLLGAASQSSGGDDFALVRFTDSGALDSSFGSGGYVKSDFGSVERAYAARSDGATIVIAGWQRPGATQTRLVKARYFD